MACLVTGRGYHKPQNKMQEKMVYMEKQKNLFGEEILEKNLLDDVYTPESIAKRIIDRYLPKGKILEPCRGKKAFFKYLNNADWCEIDEGRNFFDYNNRVDWIITNPPYSCYDKFLEHSFEIADNIVFLVPLGKVFNSWERIVKINKYGGIKDIWIIGTGNKCGFPFGFPCGSFYFKKDYKGSINIDFG